VCRRKNKHMKIWLNGKIVNDKNAKISVFDRGFMYGDGVFETMGGSNGVVFKLGEHLDRIYKSFKITGIRIPYSKDFLRKQIYRLLKVNKLKDAYIRLTVTRGTGTVGLAKIECKNPTVVITAKQFKPYPAWMYKKGIRVKIIEVRQNENSPVSGIKTVSFLNYILARLASKKAGFDDAIMLNSKGKVCEATVSNIFLIKRKKLITPSLKSGILPGITRRSVMKIAPTAGLKVKEALITPRQLYDADEVFLTNSIMEIMPVVRVDNRIIGSGKPGPITKRLHAAYTLYLTTRQI